MLSPSIFSQSIRLRNPKLENVRCRNLPVAISLLLLSKSPVNMNRHSIRNMAVLIQPPHRTWKWRTIFQWIAYFEYYISTGPVALRHIHRITNRGVYATLHNHNHSPYSWYVGIWKQPYHKSLY